ncbi:type II secretion system protein [bacterium]|jgi:prepilin-type N-terminal cleavage/methylation domain-containing protein|nr:type II secretion system protein [bacterium]
MKKDKGFTLIELIVAVLFFSIASASIALFYANNSRRIVDSERNARLEVAAEKAYETFKGNLMQRMYDPGGSYSQLVFDSIWQTYNEGDLVFAVLDTINGVVFNSNIIIDSFEFDINKTGGVDDKNLAKTYNAGSRIWATVKTINLSKGDTIEMQTVFSHHR